MPTLAERDRGPTTTPYSSDRSEWRADGEADQAAVDEVLRLRRGVEAIVRELERLAPRIGRLRELAGDEQALLFG